MMNSIDLLNEQVLAWKQGIAHAMATIVQSDGSTPRSSGKMLVFADGTSKGTIGGGTAELLAIRDAQRCIREGRNQFCSYDLTSPDSETGMTCGGRLSVFIEAYVLHPLLVMCGAGHVGGAVMKLAAIAGFDILLIDDREDTAIAEKIALADQFVRVRDFESGIRSLRISEHSYIVIATHGHLHDSAALMGALTKKQRILA